MYLVIELQFDGNVLSHLEYVCATLREAESKFHQILAYAATSNIQIHSAALITKEGSVIKGETYSH